jgi:GT2 family glycosyltransferase
VLTKNDGQFNKAVAFNAAVKLASFDKLVLHDADIIVPWCYTIDVVDRLDKHDGLHLGKYVYYLTSPSTVRMSKQGEVANNCIIERRVGYFEGGSVACKFNTFVEIGGFNEDFKGYGNEDTDFYSRLSNYGNFYNERTYNFIHLWHDRTEGWVACYDKNKEIEATLNSMPMTNRTKELRSRLIQSGYVKR